MIHKVLNAANDALFTVELLPEFQHKKIAGSSNKAKCEECGEYVFDRSLRKKDGKLMCIPCSGYGGQSVCEGPCSVEQWQDM